MRYMIGSNSYIQLCSTMRKMRTDPIQGIMNYRWHWWTIQLRTYLLETTWAAGAIEGTSKTILLDLNLQENLVGAILPHQMAKNWSIIWTKKYTKTSSKLEHYKRWSLHQATKVMESKRALANVHARGITPIKVKNHNAKLVASNITASVVFRTPHHWVEAKNGNRTFNKWVKKSSSSRQSKPKREGATPISQRKMWKELVELIHAGNRSFVLESLRDWVLK